jgi:uncharacterized protein (DUF885 family)
VERDRHVEVLGQGAMPLDVLDAVVRADRRLAAAPG